MNVNGFVVGFHSWLEKISILELSEKLEGHMLLWQADLDVCDQNIVIGSAGENYSLQGIETGL